MHRRPPRANRPFRRPPRRQRWWSLVAAIGVLLLFPQLLSAQDRTGVGTGGVGALSSRDERFRRVLERLLLEAPTADDLAQGWALAADLGRPAAPLLWEVLAAEKSNAGRRIVVLAAAVLAGGPGEDDKLFTWLDAPTTIREERVMAGFLLAMGPERARPVTDLWTRLLGPAKAVPPVLGIAARLAAARFPGNDVGAPGLVDEDDPGLAAAAAFAGLPVRPALVQRLWDLRAETKHRELFWRGALLGGLRAGQAAVEPPALLLEHARQILEMPGESFAAAREAAALYRAVAGDVRAQGPRPEWQLLQAMASTPAAAEALQPWLKAVPQPRDEEPARLAVAYVLSRSPDTVVAERSLWGADPRIGRHVAVALAWRLLGSERPQPIEVLVPGVAEWFFVRWAAGPAGGRDGTIADAPLEAAAALAADGRLPRAAARTLLEETLWRWGSHPGLGRFDAERLLVRDLLLFGSRQGGKWRPHVRNDLIYRAAGIDKDDPFFDVAVPLWDFLSRRRQPMPSESRLR
jgi:hypothetical protein